VPVSLSLVHEGEVKIEDRLYETDDHETGISNLLSKWEFSNINSELVGPGKVGVSSCYDTIVINYDNLFVGYLGLSVAEDTISINIPWVRNRVVVKNTFLVMHYHVLIKISQVHNTQLISGHSWSRERITLQRKKENESTHIVYFK